MIRIVIDTNLYVSSMINQNSRLKLNLVLENPDIEILFDDSLLSELQEVISRPKFRKYISTEKIYTFLELLVERATFVETKSVVMYSPDPKDDFLLALCQDGKADYLLTGNKKDLLDLQNFGSTSIVSLSKFLDLE